MAGAQQPLPRTTPCPRAAARLERLGRATLYGKIGS